MSNMLCLPFYMKYLRSCIIAQRRTTMLCAKNKHLGQTGDQQFFLIRPYDKALPCIGLTFFRLVAHTADHQAAPSMLSGDQTEPHCLLMLASQLLN